MGVELCKLLPFHQAVVQHFAMPRHSTLVSQDVLCLQEDRYRALMDDRTRRQTTAGTCGKRVQQWHKARQAAESKKVKVCSQRYFSHMLLTTLLMLMRVPAPRP